MRKVLHIVTTPDDPLAAQIIAAQQKIAGVQVEVVDLQKEPGPDYKRLLEQIFAADSVTVW